jgi:4-amino-4-deoxy-L-arabinose transferase-like glycosyltransferase
MTADPHSTPPLRLPPPSGEATPLSLLIAAVLLCCAPLIAATQFATHLRFDTADSQMFGYFGWRIAHGGVAYLDVWDNKPPGIYWINALGFLLAGGDSYLGVVALCVIAALATHVLFFTVAASNYFRGAAAVATVLASFYLTHGYYQGGTNRTETFLVVLELAAVAAYVRGQLRDQAWRWLLAGAFCGAAFMCKQVGLAAWGAMGVHTLALLVLGELRFGTALRRCVLLLVGMLLPVAAAVAVLAAQGALAEAYFAVVTFNRAYFEVGVSSFSNTYVNRVFLAMDIWNVLKLPALMAIAAVIHAWLWWLRPLYRPPEIETPMREFRPACPQFMLLLLVWFLVAAYGAVVSPHRFRHYVLPTLPPILLMAGYLINLIQSELSLLFRLQQRAWATAAYVAMFYFAYDAYREQLGVVSRVWLDRFPERGDPKKAPWEAVGDELATIAQPGERIQCWGYFPGVYLHAKHISASRFVTTEKIGQVRDHAEFQRRELHDVLSKRPPEVFVIPHELFTHYTSTTPEQDNVDWLGQWLGKWIDQTYVRVREVFTDDDNVYIYRRRDLLK